MSTTGTATQGFTTGNGIDAVGTHLVGYVEVGYDRLVEVFGNPHRGDYYKIDAEWTIRFDDGLVATIYDWKIGVNYNGPVDGIPPQLNTDWHIGGNGFTPNGRSVVERIGELLGAPSRHA